MYMSNFVQKLLIIRNQLLLWTKNSHIKQQNCVKWFSPTNTSKAKLNGIDLLHELARIRIPDSDSLSLIFIVATQLYASVLVGNPITKKFRNLEFLDPDLVYLQNVLGDMYCATSFCQGVPGPSGLKGSRGDMGPTVSHLDFNVAPLWKYEKLLNRHLLSVYVFAPRVLRDYQASQVGTDKSGKWWDYNL